MESGIFWVGAWVSLISLGWLIWGFSTFAQQALCIISAILVVTSGHFIAFSGALLGLILFIAVHPAYAIGYLKHTLRFIRTYREGARSNLYSRAAREYLA